jgi:hypothetical protein
MWDMIVYLTSLPVSNRKMAQVMELVLNRRCSHETISNFSDQVISSAEAFEEQVFP